MKDYEEENRVRRENLEKWRSYPDTIGSNLTAGFGVPSSWFRVSFVNERQTVNVRTFDVGPEHRGGKKKTAEFIFDPSVVSIGSITDTVLRFLKNQENV